MPDTKIKSLGEIALRVTDLDRMQAFYENVVGLALLRRFPNAAFFNIAEGYQGHTQILALFDRAGVAGYQGLSAAQPTVDHLAFTIGLEDFQPELERLNGLGLAVRTSEHAWVQWRSRYFDDPDGNLVEFVCFDANIKPDLEPIRKL